MGGSAGSPGGSGGIGGSPTDGSLFDVGLFDAPPDPDAACGLITEKANASPLNLYIVMDKSSSMVGNKWDSAVAGLTAFVNDANSAGIRVALNFFPRPPPPTCDQMAYQTPVVAFGELPANAMPIIMALGAEMPNGLSTPTYPALGGAILEGIAVAQNSPGETSAVLLVTDGLPQGPAPLCAGQDPEDPAVIAGLAMTGATFSPPVLTYVIGLPGVDQSFANQVAAAGGTDQAIIIGATNVQQEFADALSKVRGQALPCEYDIPDKVAGGEVAFNKVNVLFTPGGGGPSQTIPQTDDCAADPDAWRYDDAANPTRILLCSAACDTLKGDFTAQLDILLGCDTQTVK